MSKKIKLVFTYEDGVLPDPNKEHNAIQNINNWIEPLADELNANNVTAELYIDRFGIQHLIMSSNISNELHDKVQLELEKYQYRLDRFRPPSM